VIIVCRSGSHFEEMSYMSKTSHRSITALYSYSGLPYQVLTSAVLLAASFFINTYLLLVLKFYPLENLFEKNR